MERFEGTRQSMVRSVLIAEEDPRLRRILRMNLEREGFCAIEISSIADFEGWLRSGDVGLVIVSTQSLGFDVSKLSQWLHSDDPEKAVPAVIISFEPEDRALASSIGSAEFKLKPFDPSELVSQVNRLMKIA